MFETLQICLNLDFTAPSGEISLIDSHNKCNHTLWQAESIFNSTFLLWSNLTLTSDLIICCNLIVRLPCSLTVVLYVIFFLCCGHIIMLHYRPLTTVYNSFISHTASLWNSLPGACFPRSYNLDCLNKRNINSYLQLP